MTTSVRAASTRTLTTAQQQLVIDHAHIVPGIARLLVKRFSLPSWIDIEEMESCGYVGLCSAAIAFDPTRGIAFGTFAHYRVRGCIIDDYLRRQPPVAFRLGDELIEGEELQAAHAEPADPSPSVEDVLIEQGEQRRKCRHLSFASVRVSEIEFRCASKKHMNGETLREIGAAEGRSASWAHYRVHCGERQLREALLATCAD
ncbi:MAG: sigma factor [Bryobacteraceae bacterium]